MTLEIILFVIWGFDAIVCVAWLIAEHRRKHPKPPPPPEPPEPPVPCDSCQKLTRKNRPRNGWRYNCSRRGVFDIPPEFCCDWEKRTKDYNYTEDGGNDNAAD